MSTTAAPDAVPRTPAAPAEWDAARIAIAVIFLLDGLAFGAWVAHLPLLKRGLGLSDLAFAGVLAGAVGGAFIAQPAAGLLATRLGSRRVTRVAAVLAGLALAVPAFARSPAALAAAAAWFGCARGATEVPMNAQAAQLEARDGRPRMSSFHACFSLGGFLGAGLAALLLRADLGARVTLALVGGGCALAAAAAGRYLLHAARPRDVSPAGAPVAAPTRATPTGPRRAAVLRDRVLGTLGVLAFCGLFGEGAMADWSALLLERTTGATPAAAALGYAAFSVAMTAGRMAGDAVVARAGGARTLRASGLLAAAGMTLALRASYTPALFGCAVVGLGYANLVPILFSAGGRRADGAGVAAVSTLGYAGFVVGPPVIGGLSQLLGSLPGALAVVAGLAVAIAAGAGAVGAPEGSARPDVARAAGRCA